MNRENVGAFLDAVYAIAITILALEVPDRFDDAFTADHFSAMLLEYVLAFVLLFAFWLQHRRINGCIETYGRRALWLTAGVLLLVCLVPRATTLVFDYGGDVTLTEVGLSLTGASPWSRAELVDLFYVALVLGADLALLGLSLLATARTAETLDLRRSKGATSAVLAIALAASLLLPVENRYLLVVLPLALFFERELLGLYQRRSRPAE